MAKKLAVRAADAFGRYGDYTSQNHWIIFVDEAARKEFMKDYGPSGRVWIDPQNNEVDEIELLDKEVVNLKDKVAELEAALAAAAKTPAAATK